MFNQRNIFQNANNYSFNTQRQPVNYKMGLNNNGIPKNYGTTFNNNSYASNQVTPETGVNNPYVTTNDIFNNKNTLMPSEFLANPSLRPQFMDFNALTPEQKQNYGINYGRLLQVINQMNSQQNNQPNVWQTISKSFSDANNIRIQSNQLVNEAFQQELENDLSLLHLGAENFFNYHSKGQYAKNNPDYIPRKNDYYNSFTPEWKEMAIKADETVENIADIINWQNTAKGLLGKNTPLTLVNKTQNLMEENHDAFSSAMISPQTLEQKKFMDFVRDVLYNYNWYPKKTTI